ncbi:MAG: YbaB/EbfC family nucleoid-associated protein [Gammaproteobacteria bacterium]
MGDDGKKTGVLVHSGGGDKARQLHEKLHASITKTQAEFGRMEVCGASGGGMVKVKMNCERKVRAVEIAEEVASDREMLQDLVASAVSDVLAKVEEAVSEKMRNSVESALSNPPESE